MKKLLANIHWLFIVGIAILVWRWFDYSLAKNFDTLKPVIEGIVGGVVTALLLLVFTRLWHSNITPWFENLTYRDAKIEGVWTGFLVPYMGIEEIDRLRVQAAWRTFMQEGANKSKRTGKAQESIPVESTEVSEDGQRNPSGAELVIPERTSTDALGAEATQRKKRSISITLSAEPIIIRAEFWRTGHAVTGRLFEIGGASNIHTYFVEGLFKNLILCGSYENENRQNIDRGSFSIMLRANGARFEGFFASYADEKHKIHPFRCVLKRASSSEA